MMHAASSRRLLWGAYTAIAVGITWQLLRAATNVGGAGLDSFTANWVYMAVEFIAIAVCASRPRRRPINRLAWTLLTVALVFWSIGDLLWAVWLGGVANPPFPSAADIFYLLMYPTMYAALMLLIRARLRNAAVSQWLDGSVLALTVGGVAAALAFPVIVGEVADGRVLGDLVTVAYPAGDLILLMFVALAYALAGWRPGPDWMLLAAGVTLMAVADIVVADQVVGGSNVTGNLLNAAYLSSFALLAIASQVRPPRTQLAKLPEAPHTILLTVAAAAVALGLLVAAAFTPVTPVAVGLAAGALVMAAMRSGLTYLESVRLLRAASSEAVTDALTGLGNRRRLITDLERFFSHRGEVGTLVFFDLNGFKRYNDTYGHLAGDALLVRLGSALQTSVDGRGVAYRSGGDEFCVLLDGRYERSDRLIATARAALRDQGHGFVISAAFGVAVIPDEATSASEALRRADERMYADKARSSRSPTRDVLMQLLSERTPHLHDHAGGVTDLAAAVALELHLDAERTDETLRAAELHDIGKLAIPDEILEKPGPLDAAEWEFVRQHPIIGQRILNAAPALAPVATLVRASHERWDGTGYPDALAGEEIPLGARIVAVCDAFDAMTSERCYRVALSTEDALAELKRHAGTQFDPDVVDALARHLPLLHRPSMERSRDSLAVLPAE